MDYDKLIVRWRNLANRWENGEQLLLNGAMRIEDELRTAATAISTLQIENQALRNAENGFKAENEKLRTRNTKLEDTVRSQRNGLRELRAQLEAYRKDHCAEGGCAAEKDRDAVLAELERVTAERDAAVEDLEEIMSKGGHNIDTCHFCTNGQCYGRGGTQVCGPKWRGIRNE